MKFKNKLKIILFLSGVFFVKYIYGFPFNGFIIKERVSLFLDSHKKDQIIYLYKGQSISVLQNGDSYQIIYPKKGRIQNKESLSLCKSKNKCIINLKDSQGEQKFLFAEELKGSQKTLKIFEVSKNHKNILISYSFFSEYVIHFDSISDLNKDDMLDFVFNVSSTDFHYQIAYLSSQNGFIKYDLSKMAGLLLQKKENFYSYLDNTKFNPIKYDHSNSRFVINTLEDERFMIYSKSWISWINGYWTLSFDKNKEYLIKFTKVNVRDRPSIKGRKIFQLRNSEKVEAMAILYKIDKLYQRNAPWVKIRDAKGREGYIWGGLLRPIEKK